MRPYCETCHALTDLLIAVTDKFVVAVAALADLAGTRQHASFNAAQVKVGMLREEYEWIKGQLDSHRTQGHAYQSGVSDKLQSD